ncbi:MAG: T9SS type A sorting domain-containing protein [Syntrophomonadaceae bacterium]
MMTSITTRGLVTTLLLSLFTLQIFAQSNNKSTSANAAAALLDVYSMPATLHQELTGKNTPATITPISKMSVRVARGEFESLSLFIQPKAQINNIKFNWTDFKNGSMTIPANRMDVSIVKVWYQSGYKSDIAETGVIKHLTQEVLVKNDNLIKVDYSAQTNLLLCTKKSDGTQYYQNISDPNGTFPTNDVTVKDADTLQPFSLDGTTNRQIWMTVHVPDNAQAGKYTTTMTVTSDQGTVTSFPIEIEVLPFNLDQSRLTYSIYYHGYADKWVDVPFNYNTKNLDEYRKEMQDLKDHGVLYPTTYQILNNLDLDLQIRKEVGLPMDKLFTLGLGTGNSTSTSDLNNLKSQVQQWKDKIAQYGGKELYVYGIDEARGTQLTSQRAAWTAVHDAGAKVFVAGYYETFDSMGDILDVANIQQDLRPDQAQKYHSKGNKIFSYSNPQVGQENPELYRRNYGLALWKAGYDGAMNYAYQKFYNSEWNDFDNSRYREETFTYATSNGILGTIEWDGFREGVDDVRYLSTLLNKIDSLKKAGKDVSTAEAFVNSIDPTQDMDQTRSQIIDQILNLQGTTTTAVETVKSTAPGDYKLDQNYPNPFNPSTKISYTIPQNSMVSLKVFDMLGKEVATLVNEQKAPGSYEVTFDGANLTSGMYVYELKTNNFVQNKKMMLVK